MSEVRGSRVKSARAACHAVPSALSWLRYSMAWPRSCWLEVGSEAIWMAFSTYSNSGGQERAFPSRHVKTYLGLHFLRRLEAERSGCSLVGR